MSQQSRAISLFVTDYAFRPEDVERLRAAVAPGAVIAVRGHEAFNAALSDHPEADVVCAFFPPPDLLERAPHLRWIALPSAGADYILRQPWIHQPGIPIITTANGVHTIQISEFALSAMLLWAKQWPELLSLQAEKTWPETSGRSDRMGRELYGSTLLVVGLGAIGRRIAQLGRAFGMRVIATRRSAEPGATDPDVDELAPSDALDTLLPQADYVVLALPSAPTTRGLMSAERLALMKPTALLVNIARGNLIDEDALDAALRSGKLGGAALDVTAQEPLPPESPLWTAPNCIISPHISGFSPHYSERLTDLLVENIARYREGRPLLNQVDVERGY